jgi:hypothetical protein
MPTIAWFYGIAIRMYFLDHPPPHFEAVYGGMKPMLRLKQARPRMSFRSSGPRL